MNDLANRLASLHTALLCDALDAIGHRQQALGPTIRPIAGGSTLVGRAYPLRCAPTEHVPDAPYAQLIEAFDHLDEGHVVVIQTGDQISAMWGELLSTAARAAGATGAVMDGLVRDIDDIESLAFPVFGTGVSPLDSAGRQDVVEHGRPVSCGAARVEPGDWIVGDAMGVVAVPAGAADEVVERAEAKSSGESTARLELERGDSLKEVFERHGIL